MGRKKERSKRQIIEPLGRLQRKDVGTELKVTYRTEKQLLDNQRHKCNRTREGCAEMQPERNRRCMSLSVVLLWGNTARMDNKQNPRQSTKYLVDRTSGCSLRMPSVKRVLWVGSPFVSVEFPFHFPPYNQRIACLFILICKQVPTVQLLDRRSVPL